MVGGNVQYFINTRDLKCAGRPELKNPLGVKKEFKEFKENIFICRMHQY